MIAWAPESPRTGSDLGAGSQFASSVSRVLSPVLTFGPRCLPWCHTTRRRVLPRLAGICRRRGPRGSRQKPTLCLGILEGKCGEAGTYAGDEKNIPERARTSNLRFPSRNTRAVTPWGDQQTRKPERFRTWRRQRKRPNWTAPVWILNANWKEVWGSLI